MNEVVTPIEWDEYFLRFADLARIKSKDPSSTIGAVIVGPDHEVISSGYNGFPRGVADLKERWEKPAKYEYVVHAEHNAILNAARLGHALKGSTLYLVGFGPPTAPCIGCAKSIIQSGIIRVVGKPYKEVPGNWMDSLKSSMTIMKEAGVEFIEWPM